MIRVFDCLGRGVTLTLRSDLYLYSSLLKIIRMSEKIDLYNSQSYANQHLTGELERIYHLIEKFPSAFLSSPVNNALSIKCKDLKLKDNGFYDGKPKP